jgi:hypothetical protein
LSSTVQHSSQPTIGASAVFFETSDCVRLFLFIRQAREWKVRRAVGLPDANKLLPGIDHDPV